MRLFEFDVSDSTPDESTNQIESIANLITVLNVVLKRAGNENTDPSISTQALINLVKNTGIQFDYNALLSAYEKNSAVHNLIKNFSKETVDLIGSADDALGDVTGGEEASGEAIANIAKRVAKRNIG